MAAPYLLCPSFDTDLFLLTKVDEELGSTHQKIKRIDKEHKIGLQNKPCCIQYQVLPYGMIIRAIQS